MRLDAALVERGLIQSRERAKTTIMSGLVFVNNQKADKAGEQVTSEDIIEVRGGQPEFVSRGGKKLEKALDYFRIDVEGKLAIDAGASTGGFSDCMLKRGVAKIYAVDVGYGQLAWSVRNDPRVVCMERTNVRYISHEQIPEELDLAVIDVSFISLSLVLGPVGALLKDGGECACLIKPQFEAGKERVGKKGVVRDPQVHKDVLEQFIVHAQQAGFGVKGITFSPITGPEGNIEFLGYLSKGAETSEEFNLEALVEEAHGALKG